MATTAALLLAACGDDDDGGDDAGSTTTSTRPTTTTTEPEEETPTAEVDELQQDIQRVLTAYDEALGEISADPSVASNRDHPAYGELRAVLAPDSPLTDPLINGLVAAGNRGERQVANERTELPVERRVEGSVDAVSDSEFSVLVCGYFNYGVFNSQNQQIDLADGHVEPATATIVRVGGGDLRILRFDNVDYDGCEEDRR
jgi:hypothetical protein